MDFEIKKQLASLDKRGIARDARMCRLLRSLPYDGSRDAFRAQMEIFLCDQLDDAVESGIVSPSGSVAIQRWVTGAKVDNRELAYTWLFV